MPKELPDPIPKRLNVGCGFDIRPGFLNVDFVPYHDPDLVADVTDLAMLPSGYFDEIIAQDVLEHFERSRTSVALTEWSRLLSATGKLMIRVPSMFHMIDLLVASELQGPEAAAGIIHLIYGTQAYTGDYHLAGFTPSILQEKLTSAGLVVSQIELRDEWLYDIIAVKGAVSEAPEWPRSRVELNGVEPATVAPCIADPPVDDPMLDILLAENERLRAELARNEALLTAVRQSTSWRVTRPIRAIKELLPFKDHQSPTKDHQSPTS